MKLFFRDDRLFEEAGHDPEKLDTLIQRVRRARSIGFFTIIGVLVLAAAATLWLTTRLVGYIGAVSTSHEHDYAAVEWLLKNKGVIPIIVGPVAVTLLLQMFLVSECNTCLRFLLFSRANRERQNLIGSPEPARELLERH